MACKCCLECLLKLLNFLLTVVGLAMVGYGIYLFVDYKNSSSGDAGVPPSSDPIVQLGRPLMIAVSLSSSIFDKLPKAWFIYLFIGAGVVLFLISCFGCIATATRNVCCLTCYSVLVILLILVELGLAGFMFFDRSWEEEIPTDKTGNFDTIYGFLDKHWKIVRWVALGIVIFEKDIDCCKVFKCNCCRILTLDSSFGVFLAMVVLLALVVRATNRSADYGSDDEYIDRPRRQIQQPLINRQPVPATGVPVAGTLDQRPSRNDAWSKRMKEKFGLDTSDFTYNPSGSNRFQQTTTQPAEEKSRCTIM